MTEQTAELTQPKHHFRKLQQTHQFFWYNLTSCNKLPKLRKKKSPKKPLK